MKKIKGMVFLLATLFLLPTITGCSSSDDDIIGKWKMIESSNDGSTWRKLNEKIVIEIQKDGNFIQTEGNNSMKAQWKKDGNNLILSTLEGKTIMTAEIKEVSKNELVISNGDEYIKYSRIQ